MSYKPSFNRVDTIIEKTTTSDRVEAAAALGELRLPPTKQVGGTRRRVTAIAQGGIGGIKGATYQQSN